MATTEIRVPNIGDFKQVGIIEVLVNNGDAIRVEQPLLTLESDKATMEVPSPHTGIVKLVHVKVGDKVSEGSLILSLEVTDQIPIPTPIPLSPPPGPITPPSIPLAITLTQTEAKKTSIDPRRPDNLPTPPLAFGDEHLTQKPHAGPAVRHLARELGVDLAKVKGTGRQSRILKQDVQGFVKKVMTEGPTGLGTGVPFTRSGLGIPEIPEIDFSQFGEIETQPLSRIKKLAGAHLHRSWLNIPHVTQFDEADITELEQFRKDLGPEAQQRRVKVTMLAFLLKASVAALKEFPDFNASLDGKKENLILKHYYHIGVAVDTPQGLVVPVIRQVNFKGLFELAAELGDLSQKARDGKLTPSDMQGASFTISSLGGIGGTGFTPIINAPEVAILGVSRAQLRPTYLDQDLVPRLILPFSVSYDHRVIDGAAAARFTHYLSFILSDVRRLLL